MQQFCDKFFKRSPPMPKEYTENKTRDKELEDKDPKSVKMFNSGKAHPPENVQKRK